MGTGPQKIPFANTTSAWYQDDYPGSVMESNVGVVHTTEGTTLPSYGGGASSPNVTGVPDLAARTVRWYQHHDVDRSSRALVNRAGGVETNTLNAFQVELVGTCDPATRDEWRGEGRSFIFWPDAPDWALAEVAKLVRWLSDQHLIQVRSTVTWKSYPASYGANGVRLSNTAWSAYKGWLGHQHVPENDHGDPGSIDFDRVIQLALSGTGGEDVALTDEDVTKIVAALTAPANLRKIAVAVLSEDGIVGNANPATKKTDPHVPAKNVLANTELLGRQVRDVVKATGNDVKALKAELAALHTKVDALAVGGVDLDALAAKVASELAERLAS